ncbi:response regulator [Paenibacillus paridis]|uniref:response regulator n=1 Tax=Paenibacillus paridis TaxID=2583376 RepID=UPI0013918357|nr:response regulator [Paenibacillus paridis]
MYSLLLVEDEEVIRNGMRHCLDWQSYGIDEMEEAENGRIGLELALRMKPDIIITDVVMAEMDGIEFVRRLRQELTDKPIRVIIISGHEDIEYVRSALKLQVVDYLLKPFHTEELEDVLRKVVEACASDRRQAERLAGLEEKAGRSRLLARERLLQELCHRPLSSDEMSIYSEYAGEPLTFEPGCRAAYIEGGMLREAELRALEGVLATFTMDQGAIGGVVAGGDWLEDAGVQAWLADAGATVGIGSAAERPEELHHSFQQARISFIDAKESSESAISVAYRPDGISDKKEWILSEMAACEAVMLDALERGDREALGDGLQAYTGLVRRFDQARPDYLQAFFSMFLAQANRHFAVLLESSAQASRALEEIGATREQQTLIRIFNDAIIKIMEAINSRADQRSVIRLVKGYIRSSFGEELTLAQIAEHAHLSPNYLANLFKKDTGMTINAYMTEVRLEEAKRMLLEDNRLLIHDISERIGYKDSKYFTKLFKREFGLSPSEYRERYG